MRDLSGKQGGFPSLGALPPLGNDMALSALELGGRSDVPCWLAAFDAGSLLRLSKVFALLDALQHFGR